MPETTEPKQVGTQFKPGQSGNPAGRAKGSRNKLGEDFLSSLYANFQTHGPDTIEEARKLDPVAYVRMIAGILPKEMTVTTTSDLTDEQLDARIRQLAAVLSLEVRVGGSAERGEPSQTAH
jgi:hypothetical protein